MKKQKSTKFRIDCNFNHSDYDDDTVAQNISASIVEANIQKQKNRLICHSALANN